MATVSRITAGSHGKNEASVLDLPRPCCLPQASAWALVSPLENKQTAKENPLKLPHCPPSHNQSWSTEAMHLQPEIPGKSRSLSSLYCCLPSNTPVRPRPPPACPVLLSFLMEEKSKREKITKQWLCVPGGVERAGARSVICKQKAAIVWDRYLRRRRDRRRVDWFLACLIIRHMYIPFRPPLSSLQGTTCCLCIVTSLAFKACAVARN